MSKRYFVVIRHAEKLSDFERDPGLSEDGKLRSEKLTEILQNLPIDLVIASRLRRTQETVVPFCRSRELEAQILSTDPQAIVAYANSKTKQGALIVGHVDTVAGIVEGLCSQVVPYPAYGDYENIWIVIEEEPHFGEVLSLSYQEDLSLFKSTFQKLK